MQIKSILRVWWSPLRWWCHWDAWDSKHAWQKKIPSLKLTCSPLKMMVSNRNLRNSRGGPFSEAMLVSGRVGCALDKKQHPQSSPHKSGTTVLPNLPGRNPFAINSRMQQEDLRWILCSRPISSMGLVYLPIHLPIKINYINVGNIYPYMDGMGDESKQFCAWHGREKTYWFD